MKKRKFIDRKVSFVGVRKLFMDWKEEKWILISRIQGIRGTSRSLFIRGVDIYVWYMIATFMRWLADRKWP